MARVVVVGAGVSGLATAARLADFGHDVLVVERSESTGGRVGSYRRDGFAFDTGPSLLTLPAVYRDLFRKTGRPLERVIDLVPVDPALRIQVASGPRIDLPNASRAGIRQALDDTLGPGSGSAWQAVVDRGRDAWQALRSPYLESAPRPVDVARLAGCRRRAVNPRLSLRSAVHDLVPDRRLATAVEHLARGADPRRAPAALTTIPYLVETFGRWRVAGGMRRLAEALHDRAAECGARIRTGSPVAEITVDSGRATGIRLVSGQVVPADVVVAAVDARQLYGSLLPGRAADRVATRLRRGQPPPASLFTLLLAISGGPRDLAPHAAFLPADGDAALDAVFGPHPAAPPDPAIDVYAPDDPAMRPGEDARAVTVQVVVPAQGRIDWSTTDVATGYADHILAALADRGLDLRPYLRWRKILTPHDAEQATGVPGGAAWGLGIGTAWELLRRPGNSTPVKALFHVGSSAYPGPSLPLVGLSSMIVADLIGRA